MGNRILVVDDQAFIRHILGADLKKEGFDVDFAENGQQALVKVKKDKFDLVLLDVMMPVMDGYETCKRIKSDPMTKAIPVVFLTANAQKSAVVKAVQVGADDYAVKSPDSSTLIAKIKKFVGGVQQQ
jgi:two-component system, cell cycle response regulator